MELDGELAHAHPHAARVCKGFVSEELLHRVTHGKLDLFCIRLAFKNPSTSKTNWNFSSSPTSEIQLRLPSKNSHPTSPLHTQSTQVTFFSTTCPPTPPPSSTGRCY